MTTRSAIIGVGSLAALVLLGGCASTLARDRAEVGRIVAETSSGAIEATVVRADSGTGHLGPKMTIDDAVAAVLENNHSIRASLGRIGVDVAHVVAAGAVSNPSAELNTFVPVAGDGAFSFEVGVLQEVNDLATRGPRRTAAKLSLRGAQLEVAGQILGVAAEARSAAYDYVAAQKLLELRTQGHSAAASSAEVAERLFKAGNMPKLDMMRWQLARDQAAITARLSARHLANTRERLTRLMGLDRENADRWEVVADLPPVPPSDEPGLDEFVQRATARALTLESGRLDVAASQARVRAARAAAWPHLSVGAFADIEPGGGPVSVGPAVALELPLFSFGRGEISAARAEVEVRQQEYAQRVVDVESRARGTREALEEAAFRARFLANDILPRRREVTAETLKMYNGMYVGVFQLLMAKQEELDATAQWIESVRDYWTARVAVELTIDGGMPMTPAQQGERSTGSAPTMNAHQE